MNGMLSWLGCSSTLLRLMDVKPAVVVDRKTSKSFVETVCLYKAHNDANPVEVFGTLVYASLREWYLAEDAFRREYARSGHYIRARNTRAFNPTFELPMEIPEPSTKLKLFSLNIAACYCHKRQKASNRRIRAQSLAGLAVALLLGIARAVVPPEVMIQLAVLHKTWLGALIVRSAPLRAYLKSLTTKKGEAYDNPKSGGIIQNFISDYNIDMKTVPQPLSSYPTLNTFFSRAHHPDARPILCPEDDGVVVQPCDCRLTTYKSIDEASSIWIKGREFSIETLLGPAYHPTWCNCQLVLSRLAPSDHHRFYMPCRGQLRQLTWIEGDFYSVKPIVVNSSLNVFGVNRRCVAQFSDTPMGDIIMVIIGAAEVGSIQLRAKEGDILKKGQELGLFAYGGSSVVTLFPSGSVDFDADLSSRSLSGIETLVELGTSLGMARARSRVECPQE